MTIRSVQSISLGCGTEEVKMVDLSMVREHVSVKDQPFVPSENIKDSLNVSIYAKSLADFIADCDTPLTIGIQGEWGSGKTSLINLIKHELNKKIVIRPRRAANINGQSAFKKISINTWEHSLLKTPEECLLSILEEIISEIAAVEGSWKAAENARRALKSLARGAFRVGATMAFGAPGGEIAQEMVGSSENPNGIKALRNSLNEIVGKVLESDGNLIQRFIVFIDDLDRLDPTVAVHVLELLKNIFDIENCVFVLAIDYQVVVKGLKGKFGELSDRNEWEFRAFFDKIIQLPFMMPVGRYDVQEYVKELLLQINFFNEKDIKEFTDRRLGEIVKCSIGHNPRSIKRLINSLSLINLLHGRFPKKYFEELARNGSDIGSVAYKELLFAFVCLQISYPKIYDILLRFPDFVEWDQSLVDRLASPGSNEAVSEADSALEKAVSSYENDFDEEWEQALFRIVWINNWKRARVVELSRLLSIVKDSILGDDIDDEPRENILRDVLAKSAVTAVVDNPDKQSSDEDPEGTPAQLIKLRRDFWRLFTNRLDSTGCIFDTRVQKIRSPHSGGSLTRWLDRDRPELGRFTISPGRCQKPVVFEVTQGDSGENAAQFRLMQAKFGEKLENITGGSVQFRISENKSRQGILFHCPEIFSGADSFFDRDSEARDALIQWLRASLPKLEAVCREAVAVSPERTIFSS